MALITQKPKGTQDVLPKDIYKWETVEKTAKSVAFSYGFKEIRTPTFENTNLFDRSDDDTTDVVQKEMYTVTAKQPINKEKEASLSLKPEGTAGAVRAMIENGLLNEALPQKVFYITPCFRHEKPQAGRLREHHQFGCEMFGSASPYADAEIICLAKDYLDVLGLKNVKLFLNSIGCPTCREKYLTALKAYFSDRKSELCDTCNERLNKNAMRILDCKSPVCSEIAKNAPSILDYLCEDCSIHFDKLQQILTECNVPFFINPKIVRGFDYYTKTVFEFVTTDIGAQSTILGGGRYDGLVEEIGGNPTPALGFGSGIERVILTMESQGVEFLQPEKCAIYIAGLGENASLRITSLAKNLRNEGFHVECDLMGRSLNAQMKYANKIKAQYSLVIGDTELENKSAKLKNMQSGEQIEISLDNNFAQRFSDIYHANLFANE